MQTVAAYAALNDVATKRAAMLFEQGQDCIYRRTDRFFARLMVFQWLAGIAAALWISPKTWAGASSQTHWHVWAAIFLGGAIASFPAFLVWKQPGRALTRHTIAVAQMLASALLIHLTGGRIETHFHVFGSLAFLAFYRDWRVLISATIIVAADHFVRGIYWPQSVYGVLTVSPWRWFEHAGWVLFEDTFLFISIRQSLRDMLEVAARRANLEEVNADIERQVGERTAELANSLSVLHATLESTADGILVVDYQGRITNFNRKFAEMWRLPQEVLASGDDQQALMAVLAQLKDEETFLRKVKQLYALPEAESYDTVEFKDGRVFERYSQPQRIAGKSAGRVWCFRDVTERKRAEAELENVHKQLVDTSRQAGMAEVATGVLHNVGNVLNSVNVSTTLVSENLKRSKAGNLARVAAMFREHAADLGAFLTADPKGKQLPAYLGQLADHLTREQSALLKESNLLKKNIEHIKDIVAMQQSYAKVSGVTEVVNVSDLVEDSLRMNAGALTRHGVQVIRKFDPHLPEITVEKHKVLQILVNLIRNAKYACAESGRTDMEMTVRVTNGDDRMRIAVVDNGVGIPAENLARIFNHGFTTRKDGHGFGLHSGALAAKEMGGALCVHSDGPGHGAMFTLELPIQPPEGRAPAQARQSASETHGFRQDAVQHRA
ncbi:MAG: ATPase [Verrucomicrobia bacterium]|nr:MAG: ATPase [Verrucomicrobiota bacterium]